jgi:hypothetical protein
MKAMLLILALGVSTSCATLSPMPMQTSNAVSFYETSSSTTTDDAYLVEGCD